MSCACGRGQPGWKPDPGICDCQGPDQSHCACSHEPDADERRLTDRRLVVSWPRGWGKTAIGETINDLLRRQTIAVDDYLRDLLRARGVDPDDRSDGWEDRARDTLADLEIEDTYDMDDRYQMTATTTIRPRRDW